MREFFDAAGHKLAGGGIDRQLSADINGAVHFNGLRVRADGGGSLRGGEGFFHEVWEL